MTGCLRSAQPVRVYGPANSALADCAASVINLVLIPTE